MQTSSQCISQVVLSAPDGTLDVVIYEMYVDGSITKQMEGSWSIYDHEVLSKDELSSELIIMLLQNTLNDFKHIASEYLEYYIPHLLIIKMTNIRLSAIIQLF